MSTVPISTPRPLMSSPPPLPNLKLSPNFRTTSAGHPEITPAPATPLGITPLDLITFVACLDGTISLSLQICSFPSHPQLRRHMLSYPDALARNLPLQPLLSSTLWIWSIHRLSELHLHHLPVTCLFSLCHCHQPHPGHPASLAWTMAVSSGWHSEFPLLPLSEQVEGAFENILLKALCDCLFSGGQCQDPFQGQLDAEALLTSLVAICASLPFQLH